jgi:hypothetical protein
VCLTTRDKAATPGGQQCIVALLQCQSEQHPGVLRGLTLMNRVSETTPRRPGTASIMSSLSSRQFATHQQPRHSLAFTRQRSSERTKQRREPSRSGTTHWEFRKKWKVLHWGDRGRLSNLPITFLGFPAGLSVVGFPVGLSFIGLSVVVKVVSFFVGAEVLHWVAQPLHRLPLVRVRTLKRWRPEGFGQRYEWGVGGDGR